MLVLFLGAPSAAGGHARLEHLRLKAIALFSQQYQFLIILVTSVTSEGHSATQSSREPGQDPDPPEPPRVYFILLGGLTTISSELESSHSSTMSLHLCRHLTPIAHNHKG